jgi:hypothetical protein
MINKLRQLCEFRLNPTGQDLREIDPDGFLLCGFVPLCEVFLKAADLIPQMLQPKRDSESFSGVFVFIALFAISLRFSLQDGQDVFAFRKRSNIDKGQQSVYGCFGMLIKG